MPDSSLQNDNSQPAAAEDPDAQMELFEFPGAAGGSELVERAAPRVSALELPSAEEIGEPELDALAEEMSGRSRAFALQFQLGALAQEVQVEWNTRMRTAAGRAHYRECKIELNPRLLTLENAAEEVDRTFLHELAHLVAHHRHRGKKIQPHGREWRQACADVGIPGEGVYHQLPFEGRKVKRRYAYRCPVCSSEFERVRRFRRAVACYQCCRENCGGQYDDRFRLIMRRL